MPHIILISGRSKSGKSTLAQMITKEFDYYEIALADPIKRGVAMVTGLTMSEIERLKNEPASEVRKALQTVGETACEKDKWRWCKLLDRGIKETSEGSCNFVIPDVRKVLEARYFKMHYRNVVHLHIERPSLDTGAEMYQHKTEQENEQLRGIANAIIVNNDCMRDFLDAGRRAVAKHLSMVRF